MGFKPTRFDCYIWIRKRDDGSGYDYKATYVDDFLIIVEDAWKYMKELQKIKDPKIPDVYLGGTYKGSPSGTWSITVKDFIKEGLRQIEGSMHIKVREEKPLTRNNDHPEEDYFPILNNDGNICQLWKCYSG